jgi:hypothetical protein
VPPATTANPSPEVNASPESTPPCPEAGTHTDPPWETHLLLKDSPLLPIADVEIETFVPQLAS